MKSKISALHLAGRKTLAGVAVIVLVGATFKASGGPNIACHDPARDSLVCTAMRHIRAQVNLLGAQRDLMQVNYKYLVTVGNEMDSVIDRLLGLPNRPQLEYLTSVKAMVADLKTEALQERPTALEKANLIQNECQRCHTVGTPPPSGYTWDKISRYNWDEISSKCNHATPGRVPYRCKSMYGMLKTIDYFYSATNYNTLNFPAISAVADELIRIANDLDDKNMAHAGSADFFREIKVKAAEIRSLADIQSSLLSQKLEAVADTCMKCHGTKPF